MTFKNHFTNEYLIIGISYSLLADREFSMSFFLLLDLIRFFPAFTNS